MMTLRVPSPLVNPHDPYVSLGEGSSPGEIRSNRALRVIMFLIVVLVVVGLPASLVLEFAMKRSVWFVNGTNSPYDMEIGGRVITLPPGQPTLLRLARGAHIGRWICNEKPSEFSFELEGGPLSHWWKNDTVVINPDRIAVYEYLQVGYYDPASTVRDDRFNFQRYYGGSLVHRQFGIGHVFEELPESIVSGVGTAEARSRLQLVSWQKAREVWPDLHSTGQVKPRLAWARASIEINPNDAMVLTYLREHLPWDELRAVIEPRRHDDPLPLHIHRAWQDQLLPDLGLHVMSAEYDALSRERPNDPAAQILRARLTMNAAQVANAYQHAWFLGHRDAAIAHDIIAALLVMKDTDRAIEVAREAIEGEVIDARTFHDVEAQILAMQRRWDEAIKAAYELVELNPTDPWLRLTQFDLLNRARRLPEIQVQLKQVSTTIAEREHTEFSERTQQSFVQAMAAIACRDVSAARAKLAESSSARATLFQRLLEQSAESLATAADVAHETVTTQDILLVAARLFQLKAMDEANRFRELAIDRLERGSVYGWRAAHWLNPNAMEPVDELLRIPLAPGDRLLVLMLVREIHPRYSATIEPIVEQLLDQPGFPAAIVRCWDPTR